ncbi:MAG: primosomal protein N' [Anaerolineaceae bacterium]|nr:primosomal protein N' [Anaerolineaceae bacterium]
MAHYAEVSVNIAQITRVYHYHIPEELVEQVVPGCLVVVPFGGQTVQGVVLGFVDDPEIEITLPIEGLLDEEPVLTRLQMELAKWMSEATLAPLSACVGQMIPIGLSQHADIVVHRLDVPDDVVKALPETQKRVMSLLKKRGDLRGRQLEVAFRHANWQAAIKTLKSKDLVQTKSILPAPRVSPRTTRSAQLAIPVEKLESIRENFDLTKDTHSRRFKVLELLAKEPLPIAFSWVYAQTGANYSDLKKLSEDGLIIFIETEVWRDPLEDVEVLADFVPELTKDQLKVWEEVKKQISIANNGEAIKPILLHGVTGSGKTEIYMRAVAETIAAGKQAIILVPEIALTPQIVRRFMARFPNKIGIYHSKLSVGERYDTWRRARQGNLSVIIGARSALFMPLPNLGLIVLDECDHESYDQSDTLPYYHGVETAEALSRLAKALLILGSATPRITQYYKATQGDWMLLEMPQRILAHRGAILEHASRMKIDLPIKKGESALLHLDLPKVSLVDMRQELSQGNRSVFSRELQQALREVVNKGQQAILFLNRKGSATYVFCRECGYVLNCPRDDKPLTYHGSKQKLLCHVCGYTRQLPLKCPRCGSKQIKQLGTGTEKLEELTRELLPNARTLRWDAETTRHKGAHEMILSHFSAHRADILIGTQMLAKGLDLPLVTLVGVILAEVGLNLPDYRAPERTFQVLTQVAGRAGRSPLGGRVILQTYTPENYAIKAAAGHDYASFYQSEMGFREELNYPPFSRLVKLEFRHQDSNKAESAARSMAQTLTGRIRATRNPQTDFIGPVPCFYARLNGMYRWQIVLRGPDPTRILMGIQLKDCTVEVDPPDLL